MHNGTHIIHKLNAHHLSTIGDIHNLAKSLQVVPYFSGSLTYNLLRIIDRPINDLDVVFKCNDPDDIFRVHTDIREYLKHTYKHSDNGLKDSDYVKEEDATEKDDKEFLHYRIDNCFKLPVCIYIVYSCHYGRNQLLCSVNVGPSFEIYPEVVLHTWDPEAIAQGKRHIIDANIQRLITCNSTYQIDNLLKSIEKHKDDLIAFHKWKPKYKADSLPEIDWSM